jgi:hypothetical protein
MVLPEEGGVTYKKMRSTRREDQQKEDRRWRALTQRIEGADAGKKINK